MPGVTQCESQTVVSKPSPLKRNRLSLRFFHKKDPKRALDFSDTPVLIESQNAEEKEPEISDQVVPVAELSPPVCCVKKDNIIPFVGFNNLGNTCYLNSILQVLCYCPGFKIGIKHLSEIIAKKKETLRDDNEQMNEDTLQQKLPASYEVICSLSSLIHSVEHLQIRFLSNPENYDSELAVQPRKLLNTLRELNPMYEGYLQHDAQEVLQCILGNIQDACLAMKKELAITLTSKPKSTKSEECEVLNCVKKNSIATELVENETNCKRKSDHEVGNAKKRVKVSKEQPPEEHRLTRSKKKSLPDKQDGKTNILPKPNDENVNLENLQKKSKLGLNWLRSSKQPSILSKFCSLSKPPDISSKCAQTVTRSKVKLESKESEMSKGSKENGHCSMESCKNRMEGTEESSENESTPFDLVERLFQGKLVLRTRCLECECFTMRQEDFQDISVPVQENEQSKVEDSSDISPDPRMETKTLKWAISQFASVERIVGEDKYFCENCCHYTEAERSLLFDKIPEIVTIHLKCFAANTSEFDCYGSLSKVSIPLLTPLNLSLNEWSTKQNKDIYGLFAVVMHSGVTISSGHYTAYIRITNVSDLEIDQVKAFVEQQDLMKMEPLTEQEARIGDADYDRGVSFRAGGSIPSTSKINKKSTETVSLLGGQKSKSDFEQTMNKTAKSESVLKALPGETISCVGADLQSQTLEQRDLSVSTKVNKLDQSTSSLLQSLKEYEGKWLLFDDSEVKIIEEQDFLMAISPNTQSTSTPYLLFYKK
ncbi:hypothetical protein GDO86_007979 [Hymenochirus boettgeri]|uniref:Ubiquitin carboxyl-terminal hydrolase n=1 Tax=Hymenochirus boettgeri TaxID=247094 RepID=A0A8T2IZR4_9PIPI|nr:hypothetical protein GDO86_007979 [Hymenochirus boettgeri]KAG8437103.1 hypothetical protein GDO86_007979 [Hymenochirus boettgeri]